MLRRGVPWIARTCYFVDTNARKGVASLTLLSAPNPAHGHACMAIVAPKAAWTNARRATNLASGNAVTRLES